MPQAIRAFLESTDFEDAVRNAVSLGGDSDTLAAITGSIALAFYDNLPAQQEKTKNWSRPPPGFCQVNSSSSHRNLTGSKSLRPPVKNKSERIVIMKKISIKTKKNENNANLTELVFILDRSGSMAGLEQDTIGGFNSMLKKQKEEPGTALVSTVLFDDKREVLHDRCNISKISPLTSKDYYVRGCTALLDAVGYAIHHIGNIHKYARKEDIPQKTLFVIITDGMENASRTYASDRVKTMIERQKAKYGWEFIFIGANIDAVETAGSIGIAPECAANYCCDEAGTELLYKNISAVVSEVRCNAPVSAKWRDELNNDAKRAK